MDEEKCINNWLNDLPGSGITIEIGELDRHIQTKMRKYAEEKRLLYEFVTSV